MAEASQPTWAYVGEMPIAKLAPAITLTDRVMDFLRPSRSPIQPNTKPPAGRATNPTANTARVIRNADTGFFAEKKLAAKNAAKVE